MEDGTTRRARRQRRPPETAEQRRLRLQAAAHIMHAQGKTNTGPARAAFMARFELMADPEGVLSPPERRKRGHHFMVAHMREMQRASSRKRQEQRNQEQAGR